MTLQERHNSLFYHSNQITYTDRSSFVPDKGSIRGPNEYVRLEATILLLPYYKDLLAQIYA